MNFEEFKSKYLKKDVQEYPNKVPSNPQVSVCVQTYQHSQFIKDCLESILMQKHNFTYEILIGEDASTDGTRNICKEYADRYPDKIRLFLHHRENNICILGTPTGRFNQLYNFYSARGEFIAICDGDDYWTDPEKLQKQFDFMTQNDRYAICGHDAYIINGTKVVTESKLPEALKRDFNSVEVQKGIFILSLSAFFKNVGQYPPECLRVINFDTLIFTYLGKFGAYKYMDYIKPAAYRQHQGGIWSSKKRDWQELSELNTFFWISKYFKRINQRELQDYHGLKVVKKSISYLVTSSEANYWILIKHLFKLKYPKFTVRIIRIRDRFIGK